MNNLSADAKLAIWREAMMQLRYLNDEVWRGVALFLSLNFANLVVMGFLFRRAHTKLDAAFFAFLVVAGLSMTLVARHLLRRHRVYYLQMLAKKSLLEAEMGFYDAKLCGSPTDTAFVWRLTLPVIEEIKTDPEKWVRKSIRAGGTIARIYFLAYEALVFFYALLGVMIVLRW